MLVVGMDTDLEPPDTVVPLHMVGRREIRGTVRYCGNAIGRDEGYACLDSTPSRE